MFFVLSKILGFFALPSNLIIAFGLLGVVLMATRFARTGRRLAAGSLVLLAVIGLSPLGNALIVPLEQRFPPWAGGAPDPAGVVILGGAVTPDVSRARDAVSLNEAAERMTAVAALAARYPQAKIVFSGGNGSLIGREGTEAEAALRLFASLGIPADRVVLEDQSRNTIENALFSKEIARPRPGERWLLVTSAYHMPRSIGVFRKARFPVEAHPVDWRTRGPEDAFKAFGSIGDGLRRTDTAMREWVGLFVYWITGRSSELFSHPDSECGCE